MQTFADRVWWPAIPITVEDMDFDGWPDFRYELGDFTYNWTESCWRYEPAAGRYSIPSAGYTPLRLRSR